MHSSVFSFINFRQDNCIGLSVENSIYNRFSVKYFRFQSGFFSMIFENHSEAYSEINSLYWSEINLIILPQNKGTPLFSI